MLTEWHLFTITLCFQQRNSCQFARNELTRELFWLIPTYGRLLLDVFQWFNISVHIMYVDMRRRVLDLEIMRYEDQWGCLMGLILDQFQLFLVQCEMFKISAISVGLMRSKSILWQNGMQESGAVRSMMELVLLVPFKQFFRIWTKKNIINCHFRHNCTMSLSILNSEWHHLCSICQVPSHVVAHAVTLFLVSQRWDNK